MRRKLIMAEQFLQAQDLARSLGLGRNGTEWMWADTMERLRGLVPDQVVVYVAPTAHRLKAFGPMMDYLKARDIPTYHFGEDRATVGALCYLILTTASDIERWAQGSPAIKPDMLQVVDKLRAAVWEGGDRLRPGGRERHLARAMLMAATQLEDWVLPALSQSSEAYTHANTVVAELREAVHEGKVPDPNDVPTLKGPERFATHGEPGVLNRVSRAIRELNDSLREVREAGLHVSAVHTEARQDAEGRQQLNLDLDISRPVYRGRR